MPSPASVNNATGPSPSPPAPSPAQTQPPPQPGASGAGSAAPPTTRPGLPDRSVSENTVEDAYVDFILFCNPAVPLSTDTAKLTTKLGVEPPDPNKEESAQKVAQYGVRLKKWMNSMHVKAFFEYLMDIPNDYWTRIPTDSNPTSQPIRDGVAIEDDMALRALFPHIRPKRGRKRPVDDDTATSPAQRSHLAPSSAVEAVSGPMSMSLSADPTRLSAAPWTPSDASQQTLLFRWPQSAITPNSRKSFWDDALEPQSAVTPSKPRLTTQRRGPKNVSSAWRPGVPNGGVKPRGRPPMNRTPIDASLPPFSTTTTTTAPEEPVAPICTPPVSAPGADSGQSENSFSIPSITSQPHPTPAPPRPSRPSISLQVPERPSGSVRLATPPPVVVINGPSETQAPPPHTYVGTSSNFARATNEVTTSRQQQAEDTMSQQKDVPRLYFERLEERTNVDEVIGYMMRSLFGANWLDAEGNPTHTCSTTEAMAIVNSVLEDLYRKAASPDMFLINLAAMTGGGYLLAGTTKLKRVGVQDGAMKYTCEWIYGLGHLRGQYQMEIAVPVEMLEDSKEPSPEATSAESASKLSADEWQAKYEKLLEELDKKDKTFMDLRMKVTDILRGVPKK
ncbi:ARS-binding protein 2 [Fusarium odoratissimum]|uniref:ARS-binding protein 2 n=1 Tax=Fusarium oxysporum f. sp. cubense (strain race 4) TaxID=2502994 RepID=N1R718_FUSC4|nr:ARS-binding protein 2 [Fusarium odoratissimum]